MIDFLRKRLGIYTLQEKAEKYVVLQDKLTLIKSNIDDLAILYTGINNEFNKSLNSPGNQDVEEKIKARRDLYLINHVKDITKAKNDYLSIKDKINLMDSINPELSKAVEEYKVIQAFHIVKSKYKDDLISLGQYNDIIKAKNGKVRYTDIIIKDSNCNILLLQRSNKDGFEPNKWGSPGGHVDQGEDFNAAAKRELQEETGLVVKKCEKVGEYSDKDSSIEYYESTINEEEPIIVLESSEHQGYKWMSISEFLEDDEMEGIMNFKDNLKEIYQPMDRHIEIIEKAVDEGRLPESVRKQLEELLIEKAEAISGGLADNKTAKDLEKKYSISNKEVKRLLLQGIKVELEHTDDRKIAAEIAMDHIFEHQDYYDKLAKIEKAIQDGRLPIDILEKAKYIRREGTKGDYKYIYKEDNKKKSLGKPLPKNKEEAILVAESILSSISNIDYDFSGYSDSNGKSVYFKVSYGDKTVKVRVSDHSVLNKDRISNEVHFKFNSNKFNTDQSKNQVKYKLGFIGYKYGEIEIPKPSGGTMKGFGYYKEDNVKKTESQSKDTIVRNNNLKVKEWLLANNFSKKYVNKEGSSSYWSNGLMNVRLSNHENQSMYYHNADVNSFSEKEDGYKDIIKEIKLENKEANEIRENNNKNEVVDVDVVYPTIIHNRFGEGEVIFEDEVVMGVNFKDNGFKKLLKVFSEPNITRSVEPITKSEDQDIQKSRSGVYLDNAQNRKLKRVGQKFGSSGVVQPEAGKKPSKQDENSQKPTKIEDQAKEASGSALEAAAKESPDEKIRTAAHTELDRREKEEKPQEEKTTEKLPKKKSTDNKKVSSENTGDTKKDKKEESTKSTKEASNRTTKDIDVEIRKLRNVDIDYSDDKAMNENLKQINDLRKERQDLLEKEKGLRTVEFSEYRKGFKKLEISPDPHKSDKATEYYEKESKDIKATDQELADIADYVGENYSYVRSFLSDPEGYKKEYGDDDLMQPMIDGISSFIAKNKISESLSIDRRVKGEGADFFRNLKDGDVYEDKSFSSTSLVEQSIFGDFNIEILAKKGSSVANVNNPNELEYLIDKGSKFRVLKTSDKGIIVELL